MAKSRKKRDVLKDAYKWILARGTGEDKTEWPAMEEGVPQWYGPKGSGLRLSTAAGYMREAEGQLPRTPNYKLKRNSPQPDFGPGGPRAFSSSAGFIEIPDEKDEGGGYYSKPQYLEQVIDHEVAHNADMVDPRNLPKKGQGHSIDRFRPLEKAAYRASELEPQYNPGTDIGSGGLNEYPDKYAKLADYVMKYYVGTNPQDLTRSVKPVSPKHVALELSRQKRNFSDTGSKVHRRTDAGPAQASLS